MVLTGVPWWEPPASKPPFASRVRFFQGTYGFASSYTMAIVVSCDALHLHERIGRLFGRPQFRFVEPSHDRTTSVHDGRPRRTVGIHAIKRDCCDVHVRKR